MKHLKTASIPAALGAMVLASALSAQGTVTNTVTKTWFDAEISGYTAGTDVPNVTRWAADPAGADASKVAGEANAAYIQLDTQGAVLAYTPASPSPVGTNAIVTASIKFVAATSDLELPLNTAKACLAVRIYATANGTTTNYVARSGVNWVPMYGATPDPDTFVTVRAELDFSSANDPKVRYFVGETALLNAEQNGTDWIDLATQPQTLSIGKVAFSGAGAVNALAGQYYYEIVSAYVVTVDGTDKPILLSDEWLAAEHTGLNSIDPADVKTYLNAAGENGLPRWKSYVLGLDSEASNLWVGNVANGDSTKITIKMNGPGAKTIPAPGITVKYRLEKHDGSRWTPVGEDQDSPEFNLPLATDPTGRYHILAVFTAE